MGRKVARHTVYSKTVTQNTNMCVTPISGKQFHVGNTITFKMGGGGGGQTAQAQNYIFYIVLTPEAKLDASITPKHK